MAKMCASMRETIYYILAIDIFVLTQMVLEIIEVQWSNGLPILGSDLLHQQLYLEIQACYSETVY